MLATSGLRMVDGNRERSRSPSPRRQATVPWRFMIVGVLLFVACALGLYTQVRYLSVTSSAPLLRVDIVTTKKKKKVDAATRGNPYASYKCKGWRQTGACSPDGEREPDNDKDCNTPIEGGLSGYCEFYDPATNSTMHLLPMKCGTMKPNVYFTCNMAADVYMFHKHSEVYRHPWNMQGNPTLRNNFIRHEDFVPHIQRNGTPPLSVWYDQGAPSVGPMNGIVMVVYEKALVATYATAKYLRQELHSELPIEMWYRADELETTHPLLVALLALPNVHLREIVDPQAVGFYVKPYAIFFSHFQNVLFLDGDNLPIRDPAYLFDTPEFHATGALFWPDFWHPGNSIFNVHGDSLLWTMLDVPFADMFEQESGQLLINRARSERALHMLMFYAFHRIRPQRPPRVQSFGGHAEPSVLSTKPNLIEALDLVWGDKDLFRLAWLKTETSFHMIPHPPGALGSVGKPPKWEEGEIVEDEDWTQPDRFCGKSMVQFDARLQPLFLHRNTIKLGVSPASREKQWFSFQEFRPNRPRAEYLVTAWGEKSGCFGEMKADAEEFSIVDTKGSPFDMAEALLLKYATDAVAMLPTEAATTLSPTMSTNSSDSEGP
ncbi:Aste57867_10041 [Aphanomyces stellatus]|uniref:Aste57867_10041 protein n=1 Tax=Aphanomyces stellatus TaxID=120398 RepID=A0A485KPC7_9STRA|nr:hypothetical protein As57867_010002 [Aphanomyces stellatus]VFT86918.1 Aste57867_10041 [Aphanomyces stellatus]